MSIDSVEFLKLTRYGGKGWWDKQEGMIGLTDYPGCINRWGIIDDKKMSFSDVNTGDKCWDYIEETWVDDVFAQLKGVYKNFWSNLVLKEDVPAQEELVGTGQKSSNDDHVVLTENILKKNNTKQDVTSIQDWLSNQDDVLEDCLEEKTLGVQSWMHNTISRMDATLTWLDAMLKKINALKKRTSIKRDLRESIVVPEVTREVEGSIKSLLRSDLDIRPKEKEKEAYKERLELLREASGWNFQTPDEINEVLWKYWAKIDDELKRLNDELRDEVLSKNFIKFLFSMKKIKKNSEWKIWPIVLKIPRYFTYKEGFEWFTEEWEEKMYAYQKKIPFTLNNLSILSKKIKNWRNFERKGIVLWEINASTKNRLWRSALRWWSGSCIVDSKNKKVEAQESLKNQMFLEWFEICPDITIAVFLNHLKEDGVRRMKKYDVWGGVMRLNKSWNFASLGEAFCLEFNNWQIRLVSKPDIELWNMWTWASIAISRPLYPDRLKNNK